MGIVPRVGRRAGVRAALYVIAVLAFGLLAGPQRGHAADLRVVSGIVQSVSTTEIHVGGKTYDITGVPMRTGNLKPVSPAELSPGRKVDLYFRAGKLLLVHVYTNITD